MLLLISNNDVCLKKRDTKEFLIHNIARSSIVMNQCLDIYLLFVRYMAVI